MVQFPQWRKRIIDSLETLADFDYQRLMWVEEKFSHPEVVENLHQHIHTLYDDTEVAESPWDSIGVSLLDEREASAIESFDKVFRPFVDNILPGLDDAQAIARPEWEEVVSSARLALETFRR